MIRRPPRSTRTDTLFPYTTLFRSIDAVLNDGVAAKKVSDILRHIAFALEEADVALIPDCPGGQVDATSEAKTIKIQVTDSPYVALRCQRSAQFVGDDCYEKIVVPFPAEVREEHVATRRRGSCLRLAAKGFHHAQCEAEKIILRILDIIAYLRLRRITFCSRELPM